MLRFCLRLLIVMSCSKFGLLHAADPSPAELFSEARSLLKAKCVACHGPARQSGNLNLALPSGIKRGGKNGASIDPGHLNQSLLWKRVAADEMPEDAPLSDDEKTVLRKWIEAGAPGLPDTVATAATGDEHWAFVKLATIPVPKPKDESRVRTPVDRFIGARLEAAGLTFSADASRETLIRRVSFDLTGLPPSVEAIDQFLNDSSSQAYENMVERYLASQQYGERWGKYWLDAAGYADSNGYFGADTDRPLAYRYRDYVIRSINSDKPWDQFIREQLAGDELAGYRSGGDVSPEMVERLEAVHYLRNSPDGTDSSDGNPDEIRADKYAVLEGTEQIIGSSLLGLTVQCARCHDHKFEPFSQKDYYRLQAVIYPAFNIEQWVKPKDRVISTATAMELAARDQQIKELDAKIAARRKEYADWIRQNRQRGVDLFIDGFDDPQKKVADNWTNTVPGDQAPAGTPMVQLDSVNAPGAQASDGALRIIESGGAGDRALSTRQKFDWTPDQEGAWIQATFDLIAGGDTAAYVGYLIALRDFNDKQGLKGGNILFDGAATGQAAVYIDYPGSDSTVPGKIGQSGYVPGRNYGVRVTNVGSGKFELQQVVDGLAEEGKVTLTADDLPDGAFGFEYCCGRSFVVDNVLIEVSPPATKLVGKDKELAEQHQTQRNQLQAAIKVLEGQRPAPIGRLAAVSDLSAKRPEVHLLTRGSYKSPGEAVLPGAPTVISEPMNPAVFPAQESETANSTGSRLAFSQWLTKPDSRAASLLARVTVNRWWQHHFGTGIVATPDNFGYSGSLPTHPELLDFLALSFIESGWSAKALHRMVLHSTTYRQASPLNDRSFAVDPQNQLLSHYPLHRLDAESIRDAMLAVSGELNSEMFGPYVPTTRAGDGDVVVDESNAGAKRRSIYQLQKRTQIVGMLEAFDAPSIVFNCTARTSTTVPLQSLKLLNSAFVRARAKGLAQRALKVSSIPVDERIRLTFRMTFGRVPTPDELVASREFLASQPEEYSGQANAIELAWVDLCQMLLASNAFLYVE